MSAHPVREPRVVRDLVEGVDILRLVGSARDPAYEQRYIEPAIQWVRERLVDQLGPEESLPVVGGGDRVVIGVDGRTGWIEMGRAAQEEAGEDVLARKMRRYSSSLIAIRCSKRTRLGT